MPHPELQWRQPRRRNRSQEILPRNPPASLSSPFLPGVESCEPRKSSADHVRTEHAHVIEALEGLRIRRRAPAHAAAHLPNGFVIMLFHPANEIFEQEFRVLDAV